jgi:hypothetical protein
MPVVRITFLIALLTAGIGASMASAQTSKFPPLKEYMMPRDAEAALARSGAPADISSRATIKVLTTSGYQVIREGDNGFVCMVLRGWVAPAYTPTPVRELVYDATLRSPVCFDREAVRMVLPWNSTLGGHEFGGPLPVVSDDEGTPFAVVVIPVDDKLAIKAAPR